MPRCHARSFAVLLLASPFFASPFFASVAHAQASRPVPIPPQSLRADALFGMPPEVQLNGQATRLSPATRIRGQSNTLVTSGYISHRRTASGCETRDVGVGERHIVVDAQ